MALDLRQMSLTRHPVPMPGRDHVLPPILDLLNAGFRSLAWRRELEAIAQQIGAQHVGYGYATRNGLVMPFCSTLPTAFIDFYADNAFMGRDPVPHSIVASPRPVVFEPIAPTDPFREIFVEGGGRFGIRVPTVGVPLKGPFGECAGMAFYGLDVSPDPAQRLRLLCRARTLAETFHRRVTAGTRIF